MKQQDKLTLARLRAWQRTSLLTKRAALVKKYEKLTQELDENAAAWWARSGA